jgi:hypothetical protein
MSYDASSREGTPDMAKPRNPTAGDYILGAVGAAAAFLFVALILVVSRITGESDHSASAPDVQPVQEAPFTVELLEDGRGVRLAGPISHGMTERLEALLKGGAPILRLELSSQGGMVAEARGLVRLIETYGLSTFVAEDCLSACTLAFASGSTRTLAPGGRLGFHRYRQRSPLVELFMTAETELERDEAILRRHSVAQSFIDRIADTPHDRMWFPSPRELLDARVVDMIADTR